MPTLHKNKIQTSTGEVLMDLTSDTVTAETLLQGETAHDRSGAQITGTVIVAPTDVTETEDNEAYLYKNSEHDAVYDELVGGSVTWNQLVQNGNFESTSGWTGRYSTVSVSNNICTVAPSSAGTLRGLIGSETAETVSQNHKLLLSVYVLSPITTDVGLSLNGNEQKTISVTANVWKKCECVWTNNADTPKRLYALIMGNLTTSQSIQYKNAFVIDLTQMFDSTIADYVYNLEQSTAGSGIAWLKSYGFFTKDYYAYNAGGLASVNTSGKKVVSETTEITYPIQSTDLRGLYKLNGNKLYTDGDIYSADGQITRKYGYRGYQSGDESLANAITDGTHTIYKLSAPTTETAQPFTSPQMVYRNGTEEYLDTRDVPIPVGGNRKYIDIPDWMVNEYFDDVRAEASTLKTISKLQQENEVLRNALSQSTYFIPEGTTTITINTITDKTKCFYYIPNSVTSFGIYAFSGCDSLTSITIPNSVTSIDSSAFYYCTSLTSVTIPNSITSIVDSMFFSCTSLKSVVIPNSVTSIQTLAFYKCTSLTSITIPNSVTSIGSSAFEDCTSLLEIAIPDSITSINSTAFKDCTNLRSITIDKPQGSISGAPWGAPNATVTWTG